MQVGDETKSDDNGTSDAPVTPTWEATATKGSLGLLTLLGLPAVGPRTVERMLATGTLEEAVELARRLGGVSRAAASSLRDRNLVAAAYRRAHETLETAERLSVRVVTVQSGDYPTLLRTLADRPLVLFVRGTLPDIPCVAIVGTRKPSTWGEDRAREVSGYLAIQGYCVVSGLALGIDTVAHHASIDAGGITVAVLGSGLDRISPRANRQLADQIVETGGALVGELPFGVSASRGSLVQRDRIISGMSMAAILMESGVTGGSMQTVRFALLQGRRVYAYRREPDEGSDRLDR